MATTAKIIKVVHRKPIHTQQMNVTPDMATKWLAKRAPNRRISQRWVVQYAEDMRKGHWMLNGESIKLDPAGVLIDGQHRLEALVKTGLTIPMMVALNVPRETFHTLDAGDRRNFADDLQITGETQNSFELSATVRLLYQIERQLLQKQRSLGPSRVELAEYYATSINRKKLRESIAIAARGGAKRLLPVSLLAACHYQFAQRDKEFADLFLDAFISGNNLSSDDPIFLLREKVMVLRAGHSRAFRRDVNKLEWYRALIHVWNMCRDGRKAKRLSIPDYIQEIR